ncbi:cuticle protein CP14.6-like [Anoplolepis gracilipes]|uniref:cuticle protein CP14.6-like n=1 Tax=Anoplolepis gracilipes TaxID=354296 RepID=UPI003BA2C993
MAKIAKQVMTTKNDLLVLLESVRFSSEKIVNYTRDLNDIHRHYFFAYETAKQIIQQATSIRKYAGTENEAQLIQGSILCNNAPDGTFISISWAADEFGTQVIGFHLPILLPIPLAIQCALDWIAKQPVTPEPIGKDNPTQNAVSREDRW